MKTFKDLLDRINEVQGVPFIELASAHGIAWHDEPARNKHLGGAFVEMVLGVEPNVRAEADLTNLGLEVKTVPIDVGLRPRENTKITMLNFGDVIDSPWERSTVYHKLRHILFVPIVKHDKSRPDHWYIRSPFVWTPSLKAEATLRKDYDATRTFLLEGQPQRLTSKKPPEGYAEALIANTAGQDKADTTSYSHAGKEYRVQRRAWMLRKDFIELVLAENIGYRLPALQSG